jgi:serine/threonine-protein kinase
VRHLETGAQKTLLQGGMSPKVLAAGYLTFVRAGVLYAIPFDLERLEVSGSPVPVQQNILSEDTDGTAPYDVSANGTLVFISGTPQAPTHNIAAVDRRGRVLPIHLEPRFYRRLRLSPSGNALALDVWGATVQTWIFDFKRNVLERATHDWSNEAAEWSPDESRMAHYSNRGGRSFIYIRSLKGSERDVRLYSSDQLSFITSFTPDGKFLVFIDGEDLWRIATDGLGQREPVVVGPFSEGDPAISPDGRWLAFFSNETGRDEVFVTSFPSGGRRFRVSTSEGRYPKWTRFGKELCFRSNSATSIVCVVVQTGPTFSVTEPTVVIKRSEPIVRFDVSPDGERFYLLEEDNDARRSGAPIEVVVNWPDELKEKMGRDR